MLDILERVPPEYARRPLYGCDRLSIELGALRALFHHQCHSFNARADMMSAIPYGNSRPVRR